MSDEQDRPASENPDDWPMPKQATKAQRDAYYVRMLGIGDPE